MIASIPEGQAVDLIVMLDSIQYAGMGVTLSNNQLLQLLKERVYLVDEKNRLVEENWEYKKYHQERVVSE